MNYEELKKQYENTPLKFGYYYKYLFSFEPVDPNIKLVVNCGGNPDDIYRFEVIVGKIYYLDLLKDDIRSVYLEGQLLELEAEKEEEH